MKGLANATVLGRRQRRPLASPRGGTPLPPYTAYVGSCYTVLSRAPVSYVGLRRVLTLSFTGQTSPSHGRPSSLGCLTPTALARLWSERRVGDAAATLGSSEVLQQVRHGTATHDGGRQASHGHGKLHNERRGVSRQQAEWYENRAAFLSVFFSVFLWVFLSVAATSTSDHPGAGGDLVCTTHSGVPRHRPEPRAEFRRRSVPGCSQPQLRKFSPPAHPDQGETKRFL